jgi:hypothetical protein
MDVPEWNGLGNSFFLHVARWELENYCSGG